MLEFRRSKQVQSTLCLADLDSVFHGICKLFLSFFCIFCIFSPLFAVVGACVWTCLLSQKDPEEAADRCCASWSYGSWSHTSGPNPLQPLNPEGWTPVDFGVLITSSSFITVWLVHIKSGLWEGIQTTNPAGICRSRWPHSRPALLL